MGTFTSRAKTLDSCATSVQNALRAELHIRWCGRLAHVSLTGDPQDFTRHHATTLETRDTEMERHEDCALHGYDVERKQSSVPDES